MQYRIWRSPWTRFGGLNSLRPDDRFDETRTALDVYTDEALHEIAANGFNAIWLHAVAASLVRSEAFPEFGLHADLHYRMLQTLIERAAGHHIKVFLYMQPVRSVAAGNEAFWRVHADSAGQKELATEQIIPENMDELIDMICLCTSTEKVRQLVQDTASQIAETLPDLGGLILITASEYPGHCYSHRTRREPGPWSPPIECPRCREREPWEIMAELITLMRNGIRRHSATMELIAWNWGWASHLPSPCRALLELLPKDVIVMADCERGGHIDLPERPDYHINEYSLLYGGPSELCRGTLEVAAELGLRRMTKLQLGTTHELASVVDLPLMNSIYAKAGYLKNHPDIGYMGCWNFGNFFSANTYGFNFILSHPAQNRPEVLRALAEDYFPGCNAEEMLTVWDLFSQAMKYYPFAIPFLYRGVQTYALSYTEIFRPGELSGKTAGCSYLHTEQRGDDLSGSITMQPHEFTLDEVISGLGRLAALWLHAVSVMRRALDGCDDRHELGNALICGLLFRSAENAYRAYRVRLKWDPERGSELLHILRSELETVREALPYVEADSRLGWHGEAFRRFFDPENIRLKIAFLEEQIKNID